MSLQSPIRDKAGVEGAEKTAKARLPFGVAKSVRIAALPADFSESKGADVRDILKQPDGRELVLQAIADAKPWIPPTVKQANDEHAAVPCYRQSRTRLKSLWLPIRPTAAQKQFCNRCQ